MDFVTIINMLLWGSIDEFFNDEVEIPLEGYFAR